MKTLLALSSVCVGVCLGGAAAAAPHPVCAEVQAAVECPAPAADAPDRGCACEVVASASGGKELQEVVALRVHGMPPESFGNIDEIHLAVRGADGAWKSFGQIVTSWEPGAFGIHNEGSLVSLTLVTTKEHGDLATLELKQSGSDSDMGVNAVTSYATESKMYCFGHEGRPACVELWTVAEGGVERLNDDEPAPTGYGELGVRRATRAVSLNAKGEVVIGKPKGKLPTGYDTLSGRFTLAQLVAHKDARARR